MQQKQGADTYSVTQVWQRYHAIALVASRAMALPNPS